MTAAAAARSAVLTADAPLVVLTEHRWRTFAEWEAWVRTTGLADRTKDAYVRQVRRLLEWIDVTPEHQAACTDPDRRDWAMRDYKRHLLDVERLAPASVNLALAAADGFWNRMGMKPADVDRARIPKRAPRALTEPEVRRVLRAAMLRHEVKTPRDYGLVHFMLYTGLRIGEVHAVDMDDLQISPRKPAVVVVRNGKGGQPRTVLIPNSEREAMAEGLRVRRTHHQDQPALWINHSTGQRLAVSTIDRIVRSIGEAAGLDQPLSAHVFRHTYGSRLARAGVDLVTIAEQMGHASLETTRGYLLPNDADVLAALEHLHVDH